MPTLDRRRFPRFSGRLNVRFFVDDRLIEGETRDLSMAGAFILSTPLPLLHRSLVLKIFPGYGQQPVTIEARVARTLPDGFGVEWLQASSPISANPLRSFIHDVLGITQGFVKRLEDTAGVPRFVYKFSYELLSRTLGVGDDGDGEEAPPPVQAAAAVHAGGPAPAQVAASTRAEAPPPLPTQRPAAAAPKAAASTPPANAIPVTFSTRSVKVRARMIGGYENGLVLQAEGEPVANFDRLDINVFPDDRKRRIDLKGLVSRVKMLDNGYKVYIRLTLDNDQPALSRFRVLAESLRTS